MKKRMLVMGMLGMLFLAVGCGEQKTTTKEPEVVESKETVLLITRHGKTMLNTLDRVQGWADTPLTDAGKEVAQKLGTGLKNQKMTFEEVYSSDLGRARETAEIILESMGSSKMDIQARDTLREACYGMYEGDTNSNMMARILKENEMKEEEELTSLGMGMWKISADTLSEIDELEMAESSEVIVERMTKELTDIAKKTSDAGGGNVLVVGHGMSISLFLDSIDQTLDFSGHLPNASISKVIFDGEKFKVESVGDTSYIEE